MAVEKVTVMVLKVDLQCSSCYRKAKRTLCKIPQIRDQIYNEKANTVTITVVCCSPERIRDKLCYRGGRSIKSVEIVEPKPAEAKKEPEKPKPAEAKKEPEKPKPAEAKKEPEKPKPAEKKVTIVEPEKPKEGPKPEAAKAPPVVVVNPAPAPVLVQAQRVMGPEPVMMAHGVPSVFPYVGPGYDGYGSGQYYHGYGYPVAAPQQGYYGHAYGHGNRGEYFTEEEPGCSIM